MLTGEYLDGYMVAFHEDEVVAMKQEMASQIAKIENKWEQISCPICDGKVVVDLLETEDKGKLGICRFCNLVYVYHRPVQDVLTWLYKFYCPTMMSDINVRKEQGDGRIKELNDDIDIIEGYTERGTILDIGASNGDFLIYARNRGWKVEASELSVICLDMLRNLFKITSYEGYPQQLELEENKYDAISLRHSIEHLRSPREDLIHLGKSLKEYGVLFITTPEHAKDLEVVKEKHMMPLHLVNYTRETMELLLKEAGFLVVDYESIDNPGGLDNMRVVAIKEHERYEHE